MKIHKEESIAVKLQGYDMKHITSNKGKTEAV